MKNKNVVAYQGSPREKRPQRLDSTLKRVILVDVRRPAGR
jgi:hypothetical protein